MQDTVSVSSFTEWAADAEPKIRQSLTAAFGHQIGEDATADALALAWERWHRVSTLDNPIGYVFGIGRNKARRLARRRRPVFVDVPEQLVPRVEPGLPDALAALPERQRITVTLLHAYGWKMTEVAELLGIEKTTVQNHAERGVAALRTKLGVTS